MTFHAKKDAVINGVTVPRKLEKAAIYTASQLARMCTCDLKTIHNWADRGEIDFFRTPGRQLRFKHDDVIEFLKRFHFPIPPELL